MDEAGLPIDNALSLTRLPSGAQLRLNAVRRCLSKGLSIAEAGLKSGLFTSWEASLLHAAFSAGNLAHAYRRLADHYTRRAAHVAAMKSRMMLPLGMVVIAVFVQPLPSLVAGTLSPGAFLARCLLQLLALGGAAWLFTELPHRLQSGSWASRNIPLDRVLPAGAGFGSMFVRRSVRDCFESSGAAAGGRDADSGSSAVICGCDPEPRNQAATFADQTSNRRRRLVCAGGR